MNTKKILLPAISAICIGLAIAVVILSYRIVAQPAPAPVYEAPNQEVEYIPTEPPIVYETEDPLPHYQPENTIQVTVDWVIPPLDLRGYDLCHFEMSGWFLDRLNYHRENHGVHPYQLYMPAVVTSIEHSLDMRDNNFTSNEASDGRRHQVRHDRWMGVGRTMVTSAHSSSHVIEGPLTQERVNEIVDGRLERSGAFILNATYYYIGIGFSIQENGRGRLSFTYASRPGQRAAHHARTREEREIYQEEYLARVRAERGWVAPDLQD